MRKKKKKNLNLFKLLFCISQRPRWQNNLMIFIHRKINIPTLVQALQGIKIMFLIFTFFFEKGGKASVRLGKLEKKR